jgi:hypothetical protein
VFAQDRKEHGRMTARKAYISSLGTTGLLVAAALAMLIVVGALVAFDRWPTQAIAEAESVPVTPGDATRVSETADRRTAAAADRGAHRAGVRSLAQVRGVLGQVAAQAGTVGRSAHVAPVVRDPVVSDLPAPDATADTAPTAPSTAAAQPAPATPSAPSPQSPKTPDINLPQAAATESLAEVTGSLGDTAGTLSPELGQTVRSTGGTTTQTLHVLLGGDDAE